MHRQVEFENKTKQAVVQSLHKRIRSSFIHSNRITWKILCSNLSSKNLFLFTFDYNGSGILHMLSNLVVLTLTHQRVFANWKTELPVYRWRRWKVNIKISIKKRTLINRASHRLRKSQHNYCRENLYERNAWQTKYCYWMSIVRTLYGFEICMRTIVNNTTRWNNYFWYWI